MAVTNTGEKVLSWPGMRCLAGTTAFKVVVNLTLGVDQLKGKKLTVDNNSVIIKGNTETTMFLCTPLASVPAPGTPLVLTEPGDLDSLATTKDFASAVQVRRNSGDSIGSRPRLNFVEGTGVTLVIADDPSSDELDITISASGGGGGGGDVVGPATSVAGNITTFGDTSGALLEDSGVAVTAIAAAQDDATDAITAIGFIEADISALEVAVAVRMVSLIFAANLTDSSFGSSMYANGNNQFDFADFGGPTSIRAKHIAPFDQTFTTFAWRSQFGGVTTTLLVYVNDVHTNTIVLDGLQGVKACSVAVAAGDTVAISLGGVDAAPGHTLCSLS